MKNRKKLIVISGPSGVGKGAIINSLLNNVRTLGLAVSATTRAQRAGEVDGKDYYFYSPANFDNAIKNNEFIEWCHVHGNRYGTLKSEIDRLNNLTMIGLIEIDTEGANKIKQSFPEALRIFIAPPTLAILKERLKKRKTESSEEIEKRVNHAKVELNEIEHYDYVIINDKIFDSSKEIEKIITKSFNL